MKALKFHTFSALPRIQKLKEMKLNNSIHPGKVNATTGTYAQYWCMQEEKNNHLTLLRAVLIHIGVVQKNKAWPCSGSVKPICCASK